MITFIKRLFLKLNNKYIKKRPIFFIDIPKGKLESQIIKVNDIVGYIPGISDIVITVPRKTKIVGNSSNPHCLKIEGSTIGDELIIYNYGTLEPWYNPNNFDYRDDEKGVKGIRC